MAGLNREDGVAGPWMSVCDRRTTSAGAPYLAAERPRRATGLMPGRRTAVATPVVETFVSGLAGDEVVGMAH
jgi:hypothetical protein